MHPVSFLQYQYLQYNTSGRLFPPIGQPNPLRAGASVGRAEYQFTDNSRDASSYVVGQFTWTPWSRRTLSIRALPTVDRRKGPVAAQSGPSGGPVEVPQRANRRPSDSSGSRKGPVGAQYQPHGSSSQVKKEVQERSWRSSSEAQYEPEAQEGSKGNPPDVQQASN